jgi:predicted Zn-dependent protease
MIIKCFKKITLLIIFCGFIVGCATTTNPGAVGISRQQFLIAPAANIEASAALGFAKVNNEAKANNRLVESGAELSRLKNIERRLIQQTSVFRSDRTWQWELSLIDSPEMNAACLPGGKIIFYTGLINQLHLSDAEIAAVMGHEMAHALREHGRERVSMAMAQGLALNAAALNPYDTQLVDQVMHYALSLPNSREAESEADLMGLELMARAGYDPHAAISLHQKMATKVGQSPEFLSDHPSWSTRVAEINSFMPVVWPLYEAAPKN